MKKMTLKDLHLHITNAYSRVNQVTAQDGGLEEIKVEFQAIDRDGISHTFDTVEKIVYDVLDPEKIVIRLS